MLPAFSSFPVTDRDTRDVRPLIRMLLFVTVGAHCGYHGLAWMCDLVRATIGVHAIQYLLPAVVRDILVKAFVIDREVVTPR